MDFTYGLVGGFLAGMPAWLVTFLSAVIPATLFLIFMSVGPIIYVYAERKIAGFMQDRLGPMRVGWYGMLQTVADAIKLLFKEAIFPAGVEKGLFVLGPCLVVTGAFLSFVVLPFGDRLQAADLDIGIFYVVAVSSLSTVGLIMAGWASNNKYALYGAMRSAAQIVSYEIPAVMVLLTVVMMVGSLSLNEIVQAQAGGIGNWFIFRYFPIMPIAFLVFFTATLAECNRAPFDIPEAESELVAGFHTEYSGFFFAMFFMAEYTEMFVLSAVTSVLFLGGFHSPFPWEFTQHIVGPVGLGWFWLIAKAWTLVFVQMWLRWTLPRLRVDQLMHVAWKVLLPIAMTLVVLIGGLSMWEPTQYGFPWDWYVAWPLSLGIFGYLIYGMVAAIRWQARRVRELAA
jgi:NADH-quinone oxidoreductase subunit H